MLEVTEVGQVGWAAVVLGDDGKLTSGPRQPEPESLPVAPQPERECLPLAPVRMSSFLISEIL